MIDDRIIKVNYPDDSPHESLPKHPFVFLPYCPKEECAFDSWHGVVGFDVFPFAITTRINSSDIIWLKVYEEDKTD